MKFYKSKNGNVVATTKEIEEGFEELKLLEPNTVDASGEKHVPVPIIDDGKITVNVGTVAHPMLEEHYIEWICVETTNGYMLERLHPGEKPTKTFTLNEEKAIAVYAYCNLHGLWMSEVK